ncbi:MAG TPA: glutaredoxin family protein [Candidatus Saccharimonadales bacterium]|nr:glutaredoxin family protein [Candidatus Saccharimonadales bacterium]
MSDKQQAIVKVYGAEWCAPCHVTKDYLKSKKVEYDYVNVDDNREAGQAVAAKTGWSAIPIVQIGDEYILGFNREKIDGALRQSKLI